MKHRITPTTLVIAFVSLLALSITPQVQASDDKGCSNASVQGAYGLTGGGMVAGTGSVAFVASFTSDGKGNITGTDTISFNGTILRENFTATYTVNADCTGSATVVIQGPAARTTHVDFVVVDHGNEVFNIQTDPGTTVTFTDKKIFPGQSK